MSPPDGVVSANVEITSSTSLGITGRKEKGLAVMYLLLILFLLGGGGGGGGEGLHLLTILLIGSGSFKESNKSGHLTNPKDDVVD